MQQGNECKTKNEAQNSACQLRESPFDMLNEPGQAVKLEANFVEEGIQGAECHQAHANDAERNEWHAIGEEAIRQGFVRSNAVLLERVLQQGQQAYCGSKYAEECGVTAKFMPKTGHDRFDCIVHVFERWRGSSGLS
ncbi:hypothetical protein [Pelomonas cellulosilytica]|uniref:Uncharacterized protein n=1 Tax=Pelomonas cellulosilytica TaxID=2906762 RepID=A0ABS8XW89_9BURK|nr:hypothetical protein [Pelomonas sp. P8]MCE4554901.1 hypothetical protein [Pelomonas sp. P8]